MNGENGAHYSNGRSNKTTLRYLVIGAGSRGNAYAEALQNSASNASVAAIAEPNDFKRRIFGERFIWGDGSPKAGQSFRGWQDFVQETYHELHLEIKGKKREYPMIDGVFVCTLDETHAEIICALAPFNVHIMSEKPLATTWTDCLRIYRALQPQDTSSPAVVFSTGHVLRYSPHNMLLRKILLKDYAIGDVLSIEHTEPVGWWHFSHSYVRGNWRKESKTAPSLLTKSCHDIDFILWLLCSPHPDQLNEPPHLPSYVSSTGSLLYYKKARKLTSAGDATNCLSCPAERDCMYSAKKIYVEDQLEKGNAAWPVSIIDPEVEDLFRRNGKDAAEARLLKRLAEDYESDTSQQIIDSRPWFGRCVYECANDVCDDQIVSISWEDEPLPTATSPLRGRGAKNAVFHMVASTEKQCQRRGHIYGTRGEISYDSTTIRVYDFATDTEQVYHPKQMGGGHGGGDAGLAGSFVEACQAVEGGMRVEEAQMQHLGCTLEEVVRSHGLVFAAEEARKGKKSVDWKEWWKRNI